jgi:hypothetical protein
VHPNHLHRAGASRVNHTQRMPYESKDIRDDIDEYEVISSYIADCVKFVGDNVGGFS